MRVAAAMRATLPPARALELVPAHLPATPPAARAPPIRLKPGLQPLEPLLHPVLALPQAVVPLPRAARLVPDELRALAAAPASPVRAVPAALEAARSAAFE